MKLDLRDRLERSPRRRVVEEDVHSEDEMEMVKRQRKLAKKEKKLKEDMKLEKILRKEEKVRRKLEKREKERVKSRLGAVVKVAKADHQRSVSVRRAEFSSEQPLSELLRARKDSRRAEPLPSASDYSDLESPERETAPTKLLSVVSKPIDRDRQQMEVAREERRLRMLQREMEKEDTKSSRKRKEAKHNYAAKVLGNLGTLGEVRRRPGGKEGHGEGVVGKRREERKRVNKEHVVEDEDGITEVESKAKKAMVR